MWIFDKKNLNLFFFWIDSACFCESYIWRGIFLQKITEVFYMNQFDNQEPNWGNINITDKEMFNQVMQHNDLCLRFLQTVFPSAKLTKLTPVSESERQEALGADSDLLDLLVYDQNQYLFHISLLDQPVSPDDIADLVVATSKALVPFHQKFKSTASQASGLYNIIVYPYHYLDDDEALHRFHGLFVLKSLQVVNVKTVLITTSDLPA